MYAIRSYYENLIPSEVSFSVGEKPTDEKLTGMNVQSEEAFDYLSATIGDAFGHSAGHTNGWFSNFSRDLGNRDLLSPFILGNVIRQNYIQTLGVNKVEHELDLIPIITDGYDGLIVASTDGSVTPGSYKETKEEILEEGDWTIEIGQPINGNLLASRKLITRNNFV